MASDILGVTVAIDDENFDPWWARKDPVLISFAQRGEDAASLLFGLPTVEIQGVNSQPARVVGSLNLGAGIALGETSVLRLQIDAHGPFDIDLAGGKEKVTLAEMVEVINQAFPSPVARAENGRLVLVSIVLGPEGRIEIEDHDKDAAPAVLGVPALIYTGRDATSAQYKSAVDLSAGIDLRNRRYLRLALDGFVLAEIDCAASDAEFTLLDHIRDNINAAFGSEVASHDGRFLLLRSAVTGAQSSLFLQEPAAQNCAADVLGISRAFFLGSDAEPAVAAGVAELTEGVDLSERSLARVRIDASPAVTVNCAGADPSKTMPEEIVNFLNAALGPGTASSDGRHIRLVSHTSGRPGQIVFEPAGENDALNDIFGFRTRVFNGTAALPASFTGATDLSGGVNLMARHRIGLAFDGEPVHEIDLRSHAADISAATPQEIVEAINAVFPNLAFTDGRHLLLTSPTTGESSRVSLVPLETEQRRSFTSRAMILDEASRAVLGFTSRRAIGEPATKARVVGTQDLSFGVDLREDRWVRVSIDDAPPVTVNCAGPRPRATTVEEAAARLATALGADQVAHDGKHPLLISPSTGSGSSVMFHVVTVRDAVEILLGPEPYVQRRGTDATQVIFVGTVDLTGGVELVADARVSIAVDGAAPVEIPLNAALVPARKTPGELAAAINFVLDAAVATHDSRHLILSSRQKGNASRIEFHQPSGTDATKAIFGIHAPRIYQGSDATRAEFRGKKQDDPLDLSIARFLKVSVDGKPVQVIDCAATAVNPAAAKLEEIVNAANVAINGLAEESDGRLVLHSNTRGSASQLAIEPHVAGDARLKLFGDVPAETRGVNPQPARITGEVRLLRPVDLSRYWYFRLAINDSRPLDIDIAGETLSHTTHTEIVDSINQVLPGVASLTADGRLALTSPTAGEAGSVEVFARRHLELIEYPPEKRTESLGAVGHGHQFLLHNGGAARTVLAIFIDSLSGAVDPVLVNHSLGLAIEIHVVVRAGDRLMVYHDPREGLLARIESPLGPPHPVDPSDILVQRLAGAPLAENPLGMPKGTTHWTYLECTGARFNEALLDEDHFAGIPCQSLGIFDISRLDGNPGAGASIFWPPPPPPEPAVRLSFEWLEYRNGAFNLNLPAELPPVFGGRFNEARFGLGRKSEKYERVVFEPDDDPDYVVTVINRSSTLVEASDKFTNIPLGFEGNEVPFRAPRPLTLGSASAPARIYLLEEGLPGVLELKAREDGEWGNSITVSFRPDGPARYQVEIFFPGDRFEGARSLVLGGKPPLPPAPLEPNLPPCAKKPLPFSSLAAFGVSDGKAAGVRARVTRERTEDQ